MTGYGIELERISFLVWFGFTSIDIIKTWIFILPLDKTLRQIAGEQNTWKGGALQYGGSDPLFMFIRNWEGGYKHTFNTVQGKKIVLPYRCPNYLSTEPLD